MGGGWVYLVADLYRGTIQIGAAVELPLRISRHRGARSEFALHPGMTGLVHAEEYPTLEEAIARQRDLKTWPRQRMIDLIERDNPGWFDRYDELIGI